MMNYLHTRILLLLALLFASINTQLLLSLTNGVINQMSQYKLYITDSDTLKRPGTISFRFQSPPYSFTNTTGITSCKQSNANLYSLNCNASSTNTISFFWTTTLINNINLDGASLVVTLTLLNPAYVDNFNVVYEFIQSSTVTSTYNNIVRGLTAAALSACSITFSPSQTNTISTVNIQFTTKNTIPLAGSLKIVVSGYTLASNSLTSVNALSNGTIIHSSPLITYNSNSYFFSQFFTSAIPSGSNIAFSVSTITSPPTTQTNAFSFKLSTIFSSIQLNEIDYRQCFVSVSDFPLSITASFSSNIILVGQTKTITLVFVTPIALSLLTDTFTFYDTENSFYLSIFNPSVSSGSITLSPSSQVIKTTNVSVSLVGAGVSFPNPTLSQTIAANSTIRITSGISVRSLVNSGTKNAFFQISRNGFSFASSTVALSVTANKFASASVSPLTTIVSRTTSYTFTVLLRNTLLSGASMRIVLPSDLFISNGFCTAVVTTTLTSSIGTPSCVATSNSVILVTNVLRAILTANTNLSVTISNIMNPISTKTTGSVYIQTFYSTAQQVNPVDDSSSVNSSMTVTATSNSIPVGDFTISRSNTQNNRLSRFTITYKVNSRFRANGYITLTLPSTMSLSFSSASFALTGTTTLASTNFIPTASVISSNNVITLNLSSLITSDLLANTIFTITIDTIRNYYSYKPVYPILTCFASDGFQIQKSASGDVTLTNTVEDTTLSITSSTAARINGQSTNYAFSITSPSILAAGDIITLQLQNTNNLNTLAYLSSAISCTINSVASNCSASTTRLLRITLPAAMANTSSHVLAVSDVVLSRSYDQPGAFFFKTYERFNSTDYLISSFTFTPSINTDPNAITTAFLTIDTSPSLLNQVQRFTLRIVAFNNLYSGDYIKVTVPAEYLFVGTQILINSSSLLNSLAGSFCSASTGLFCANDNLANLNVIRIVQKTAGAVFTNITQISVTIDTNVFRSPQLWATYNSNPFLVDTFTSTNRAIDSVKSTLANSTFYLTCANTTVYYCKTCTTLGRCLSCYQLNDTDAFDKAFLYGNFTFLTNTGQCIKQCVNNFYGGANKTCLQCQSPCFNCTGTANNCLSCISGQYFFNSTCLSQCAVGYYETTAFTCDQCSSFCFECDLLSTNCTGCINSYLSNSFTCVDAASCLSSQYADSSTWKCTNCNIGCNGCTPNATWCKSCSTGYIFNIDFVSASATSGPCTNLCPTGKANDTTNAMANNTGPGCRCNYTACSTCIDLINKCTSCNTGTFLFNNTCSSTCPTSSYINGTVCTACGTSCANCVNSTFCNTCSSGLLYLGRCQITCPITTFAGVQSGINVCFFCGVGCGNCLSSTQCSSCTNSMLIESNATHRYCTFDCSTGQKNVNNQYCATTCPPPLIDDASLKFCITDPNTTTTVTSIVTSTNLKFIPFPLTIALAVISVAVVASKIALPVTIVPAALCSFAGLTEALSWIVFMISQGANSSSEYPLSNSGLFVVLIAFILNLALNGISFYFFKKYIWNDDKFQLNLKKLKMKSKCGSCITYASVVSSIGLSAKFIQVLFSNLFQSTYFLYKVDNKIKFTPINYTRYAAILPSVLAIIGAGIANFQRQIQSLSSLVYIQSIDLIIVTLVSIITSIWCTIRKSSDYENSVAEGKNDMQEQFDHEPLGDNVYQVEAERKVNNIGKDSKRYSYINSTIKSYNEPKDDPLSKKIPNRVYPLGGQNNYTNAPLGEREDDENRINLNIEEMGSKSAKHMRKRLQAPLDVDDIEIFQQSGDGLLPGRKSPKKSPNGKNGSKGNKNINQDPQKQRLKENINNKLTQSQIKETKIVRNVDEIDPCIFQGSLNENLEGSESQLANLSKNQKKKEKLDILNKTDPENLNLLQENDKKKAGQMKKAMKILNRKKVGIVEYLQYLDIIQEEDEDNRSDDDENVKSKHTNKKDRSKLNKNNKQSLNKFKNNKKSQIKGDKTNKKSQDGTLMARYFDEQPEPEIPLFNQTPIRPRNFSEVSNLQNESDEFKQLKYEKNRDKINRSDQKFSKNKQNLQDELLVISNELGEDYDPSLGEQFQKGNILKQADKEQEPPSNLYATQKLHDKKGQNEAEIFGKDRLQPNKLINQIDVIEYEESLSGDQETIKNQMLDFNNDVSPSHFNEPNMRIQNDMISDAPTKPKITKQNGQGLNIGIPGQVMDLQDEDQFHNNYDNDQNEHNYKNNPKMKRYQSNEGVLDYDQIQYQRRNNQRMKELQKIYLPRIDVNTSKNRKIKKATASQSSYRKEEK